MQGGAGCVEMRNIDEYGMDRLVHYLNSEKTRSILGDV